MLNIWPVGSEEGGTLVGCGFSVDETAVYTSQCSDSAVVDVCQMHLMTKRTKAVINR